jgi:hypothetical protein
MKSYIKQVFDTLNDINSIIVDVIMIAFLGVAAFILGNFLPPLYDDISNIPNDLHENLIGHNASTNERPDID